MDRFASILVDICCSFGLSQAVNNPPPFMLKRVLIWVINYMAILLTGSHKVALCMTCQIVNVYSGREGKAQALFCDPLSDFKDRNLPQSVWILSNDFGLNCPNPVTEVRKG